MLKTVFIRPLWQQRTRLIAACLFMLLLTSVVLAQDDAQPTSVVIAGTLQSVLGCEDDWQPTCEATALAYDPDDDLWQATFELPAGNYEYKAMLNGDEAQTVGANAALDGESIALSLAEDGRVKFIYSHATGWVTDSVNALIANVPGSYQDLIGCPGEWAPDCLRSLLQDPDGDGLYTFATSDLPAGYYEAKVAVNESWSLNYGLNGARDGANIGFTVVADGDEVVFTFDSTTNTMTISVGGQTGPAAGNLFLSKAHWVSADTILWAVDRIPGATYRLHFSEDADLELGADGVTGGDAIEITYDRRGLTDEIAARFPHLADYSAFKIAPEDLERVPDILRGQIAVSSRYNRDTVLLDATGLQIPGVLDDLYSYDGPLGLTFADGVPSLALWAPTARSVSLHLFATSDPNAESTVVPMDYDAQTGVWSVEGEAEWYGQFYLYEVEVFAPSTQAVEHNLVTDPDRKSVV